MKRLPITPARRIRLKTIAAGLTLALLSGCSQSVQILAENGQASSISNQEQQKAIHYSALKTFDGQPVVLKSESVTHLVFMDIWATYAGAGAEADISQLPADFLEHSQQIWVQPEINVTREQMAEFQSYYPDIAPLVLDSGFALMRAENVWQAPWHVLIRDGKTLFSGNIDDLRKHLGLPVRQMAQQIQGDHDFAATEVIRHQAAASYQKLSTGDLAPDFQGTTLAGTTLSLSSNIEQSNQDTSLVFLDSLCPMPHFPGCEDKLKQLSQTIAVTPDRQWIGVISSFYVDKSIATQFAKRFKLNSVPLIFDQDNQIFEQYGVHATPYQINIGANGVIQSRGDQIH
ncbi:peroxiredoxin family protein [Oceanospirillum sediminis]|uniref:Redoxin domain-containing protein n=1 Tax=Oceanospirillum sediminis TaxID=2760088 RepID=A0A839IRB2_9GAMM|nr:redoxin domain-containing protein [Oceanospirillum sediminis]MBB1488023.1 redoxin domain-containing protein [Oceanospirillum sediminis]